MMSLVFTLLFYAVAGTAFLLVLLLLGFAVLHEAYFEVIDD